MRYSKQCKIISLISFILAFAMLFSGCKGNTDITPADLTESIHSNGDFSALNPLSGSTLSSYFQFNDTDVVRFSVLISASADSADTIAAFEVSSEEQHAIVVSGISGYITKLSTSLKNTMEAEYNKIQNRILVEIDDIILLVICSEPERINEMLSDYSAKPIY